MYFFTHLFISGVLYRRFSEEVTLDKRAFAYGNIKPDLPSPDRVHHTLENCLFTVSDYSKKLMEGEEDLYGRSLYLGEICHYLCDFFCYYHVNEDLHNRGLRHFSYELRLHYKFLLTWLRQREGLLPEGLSPEENISSIVFELRRSYLSGAPSMKKDISYAFRACVWSCESIFPFMNSSLELPEETGYSLPAAQGDHL